MTEEIKKICDFISSIAIEIGKPKIEYERVVVDERLFEEIKNEFDAPIIYLFNKMDIADYEGSRHDYIQEYIDKTENPLLISAAEGEGIDEIIKLITQVEKRERIEESEEEYDDENYFDLT